MSAISAEASGRGESLTSSTPLSRICQVRARIPSVSLSANSRPRSRSISLTAGSAVAAVAILARVTKWQNSASSTRMSAASAPAWWSARTISKRLGDLALHDPLEQRDDLAPVREAQHIANGERRDALFAAMRDALVEQRQRVAHRAFGDANDQRQRLRLGDDAFSGANLAQMGDHWPRLDAPQIEANAARAHRDRHLVDFGGRKQKLDVLGRLFEGLQETVEGLLREHVHFVDDIDLGARRNRAIARVLDDLAHVVDAGMGSRVHLDDVDMARLHDRLTVDAKLGHVDTRLVDLAGQGIVERAGENAGRRRLADAAHAGQDIGLMDAARGEGIGERAHHRLLADEVLEANRPVFSRQHPIGSGQRSSG